MSALIHLLADYHRKQQKSIFTKITELMSRLSEPFWFVLSFILFLVMGPFSIIAVLAGLYQLARTAGDQKSPEAAGC